MPRKPLNPTQYLAELNQRLWSDPQFCEGMSFKLYPDGQIAAHLREANATGGCAIPALFARIEALVAAEYVLVLPVPGPDQPQEASA
jgi:hypothetical protein